MVAMLMLAPSKSFASQIVSNHEIGILQDDDRGRKVDLTEPEKYALKKPAKRASGKGMSRNETNAEMIAATAARGKFATAIRSAVLSATKTVFSESNYFFEDETIDGDNESYNSKSQTEGGEKSNSILRSIANEVVQNSPIVKTEKFYNNKRRRYTVYVCVEYDGEVKEMVEKTVKKIRQRIPMKDRQRIDENMEKFEFEIEKELNKQQSANNETNNDDE